jgi:hypothetical protein
MTSEILFDRVLSVSSSDEWWNPVDAARIQLTRSDIEEILKAAELVKEHSLASVRLHSDSNEWGSHDEEDDSFTPTDGGASVDFFRSECNQAAVYASSRDWAVVVWMAYAKHTSVLFETESVQLDELRACLSGNGKATVAKNQVLQS